MKRAVAVAAIALGACEPNSAAGTLDNTQGLMALVRARSGEACAHPVTQQVIRSLAEGQSGNRNDPSVVTSLGVVTLSGIDETTGRISCNGTWMADVDGKVVSHATIDYAVQNNVQGDDVVVYVDDLRAVGRVVNVAMYHANPPEDSGEPYVRADGAIYHPESNSWRIPDGARPVPEPQVQPEPREPTPQELRERAFNAEADAIEAAADPAN